MTLVVTKQLDDSNTEPVRSEPWLFDAFEPHLMSYEEIEDNINDRHGWSAVDYVAQYLDEELMTTISDCTNAMIGCKFNYMMYADDTTLYFNLENCDCRNLDNEINSEIVKINIWFKLNKLSLNADKTKYMIFHTNQRMIPHIALSINSKLIAQVSTFNFLGIMLDSNTLWTSHKK